MNDVPIGRPHLIRFILPPETEGHYDTGTSWTTVVRTKLIPSARAFPVPITVGRHGTRKSARSLGLGSGDSRLDFLGEGTSRPDPPRLASPMAANSCDPDQARHNDFGFNLRDPRALGKLRYGSTRQVQTRVSQPVPIYAVPQLCS
jgi:hypothetical protein